MIVFYYSHSYAGYPEFCPLKRNQQPIITTLALLFYAKICSFALSFVMYAPFLEDLFEEAFEHFAILSLPVPRTALFILALSK